MAEQNAKFSHIVVGGDAPDDADDDIVIVAGSRSANDDVPTALASEPDFGPTAAVSQPDGDNANAPAEEDIASKAANEKTDSSRSAFANKTHDEFQATTLEDLEDGRMPTSQKLVLLVAVLLIIVAVAYFVIK